MGILRSQRGSALLLVMVSVMVLAILVAAGLTIGTASLRAELNREAALQAYYYASSINKAVTETIQNTALKADGENAEGSALYNLLHGNGAEIEKLVPLTDDRYTCRVILSRNDTTELKITVVVAYGDETGQVVSLLPHGHASWGEPRYGGGYP